MDDPWITITRDNGQPLPLSRAEAYAVTRAHLGAAIAADVATPPRVGKCSGQKGCVSCVQAKAANPEAFEV